MSRIGEITQWVKQEARAAGFDLAGIAPVRDFAELEYFPAWLAAGHAGEMQYMQARNENGQLKRASLRNAAPWARSVLVCAINYNTAQPYSTDGKDPTRGWISRYAWGAQDYHDAVMTRLHQVETRLRQLATSPTRAAGSAAENPNQTGLSLNRSAAQDLVTRSYVDTGPLVERVYAKYAGVGWIGKNTCILNQKLGSWMFLGVVLTSLELLPDLPAPDRCGTCTRCLDACPTHAFVAPYQLDSRKCISYLTIEKRGDIPENMREGMGRHVFGCDICQDVCPWNRQAPTTNAPEFVPRPELVNPALDWLAEMNAETFRQNFRGSPIRRAKLSGIKRNAVIAMANSGNPKFLHTLEKLAEDPDPIVSKTAKWAVNKLRATAPRVQQHPEGVIAF